MKLSTALKKGSKGMLHLKDVLETDNGCCALGAIGRGFHIDGLKIYAKMPIHISSSIIRMNDKEGRSFNYIYNWLKEKGL